MNGKNDYHDILGEVVNLRVKLPTSTTTHLSDHVYNGIYLRPSNADRAQKRLAFWWRLGIRHGVLDVHSNGHELSWRRLSGA